MQYTVDILLAVKSCAIFVLVTVFVWWRSNRKSGLPPGPTGLPLLGYIPFMGKKPQNTLAKLRKQYGSIYTLPLGSRTFVVLNDFDIIHEALMKKGNAISDKDPSPIIRWFGGDMGYVWRSYSNSYRRLRKFGITTLKGFGVGKRSMEDRVNEEVRYLSEIIMSKHGRSFDVTNHLGNAAINIIMSIVSGNRVDYESEPFKTMLDMNAKRFGENSGRMQKIQFFPLLRYLPGYSKVFQDTIEQVKVTKGIVRSTIENHIKTFDPNDIRDFIDAFLKEMKKEETQPFTREILDAVIRDLFLAGSETTTTALRWCLLYLAKHQEYQKRLRDEIKTHCGTAGPISMENRSNMHLTCSFIHEIQRYKPLAILLPRKTTEIVSLGGYIFPTNTLMMINLWEVHRDPETFNNPNELQPERFLDNEGKFSKHSRVIPFSIGPRNCIGMHLAEMELFVILSGLLRNFKISEDPKYPLPSFTQGHYGMLYHPLPYKLSFEVE
ncbi:cytochrome P450 2A13-like [Styela clava]